LAAAAFIYVTAEMVAAAVDLAQLGVRRISVGFVAQRGAHFLLLHAR
jgi:hypothetical protein